jgi:RND family efflux transporter MFP subunit
MFLRSPFLRGLLVAFLLSPLFSQARAEQIQGLVLPFKQVSVSAPPDTQDIIKEVDVEEGDTVKKGQLLAQLLSDKEELQVAQYEKLIERREFEAKGMEQLLKEKMTSQDSALEKQTDLELAKIQYQQAKVELEQKSIRSPLDGIVVKKYKEAGEATDRIEKMFDVVNIDQVYVQFYLDPKWMVKLHTGEKIPVTVPVLGDQKTFMAKVAFIDPRIDAASGLFRVKLLLDNPDHIVKAGMRAEADFDKMLAAQ